MNVILISGHAQNGKDTAAGMIKEQLEENGSRVLITHYGDLVKYICKSLFGWDGKKDTKGRSLLQHVGTDIVRKKDPDFWVRYIVQVLNVFNEEWDYVVIPDCRFPNEVEMIKQNFDTTHIRIVRSNFETPLTVEQQNHESETALNNYPADEVIENDGSVADLRRKINDWVFRTTGASQITFEELGEE